MRAEVGVLGAGRGGDGDVFCWGVSGLWYVVGHRCNVFMHAHKHLQR